MILEPIPFPKQSTLERKHNLERARPKPEQCEHTNMVIDMANREVRCKNEKCGIVLDPYQALDILSKPLWWRENQREFELESLEKSVSRVQKKAIEYLHSKGVTPEKYAEKYHALVELKIAEAKKADAAKVEQSDQEAQKAG